MQSKYWTNALNGRVRRRQALASSAGLTLGAALLVACGGSNGKTEGKPDQNALITPIADTSKQAKRGGTIKDRTFADTPTLDIFTSSAPHNSVGPHAYSTLVQFKPGYLKPTENDISADLAESWEWSPDGQQITLKLRQGVKWHNKAPVSGRTFDASDVVYSWDRFTKQSSGRSGIANQVDAKAPVSSLTAPDSNTIVIKLKEPLVYALGLFAANTAGNLIVLPKESDGGFDIRNDIIGTGPYVLSNYTPSVGYTFKRNADYWDKDVAWADQIDLPIVSEYAATLAQFKAGNIYSFGSGGNTPQVRAEDVIDLKKSEPRIAVYKGPLARAAVSVSRVNFGWLGKSQFSDERVRQAMSKAWDRDLYLDTFFNVGKFESQGLPVEARWGTSLNPDFEGWWLDPKGKDFGPNAKNYQHDITEAKKLLAAAGFANGFESTSSYISTMELGPVATHAEVLDGMFGDIGITKKVHNMDYLKEYAPQYRDGRGQFDGWAYVSPAGAPNGGAAIGALAGEYWSKGGATFKGFSATGQNDQAGDPQIDAMIEKGRVEQDTEKRRSLTFDIQRALAKSMYGITFPGLATGFLVAWPALGNFRVYQGPRPNQYVWIDDTKAPLAKS